MAAGHRIHIPCLSFPICTLGMQGALSSFNYSISFIPEYLWALPGILRCNGGQPERRRPKDTCLNLTQNEMGWRRQRGFLEGSDLGFRRTRAPLGAEGVTESVIGACRRSKDRVEGEGRDFQRGPSPGAGWRWG